MSTGFSTLRSDCRDKGWPTDHPYWTATDSNAAPAQPLAINLTPQQEAFMVEYGPIAKAQSDANVKALLSR
jgi:hypothetical protein